MTIIDDKTVVVYSSEELKSALESTTYTYIYFGSDITLNSGIVINNTKQNVVIDGTYDNVVHTFTDQKKLGTSDAIGVNSSNNKSVTVKNLNVIGYNYYGIIYVPESTTYSNTTIIYENITYVGPQLSFNPSGITKIIDSDITVKESYAAGNEVCECNKVYLGGKTIIKHESTANTGFWFRNSNPSLTIEENSVVSYTSTNRELFYGVNNLEFNVLKNAKFTVNAKNGLAYADFKTGNTLIEENAYFKLVKTGSNGSYASWYTTGSINVKTGASLIVINNFTGINTSNYNISFTTSNLEFNLDNPKKVVLYNKVANVFNAPYAVKFSFVVDRINLFTTVKELDSLISRDNLPTYSFYNTSLTNTIIGTFTNSNTSITSSTLSSSELTNFVLGNKKGLSVGNVLLTINKITDEDLVIKGYTISNSSVLISFNNEDFVVVASDTGLFSLNLSESLNVGDVVEFIVKEENSIIYSNKSVTIIYRGELGIVSAPEVVEFSLLPISLEPIICPKTLDVLISVSDSRVNSTDWKLFVKTDGEFKSSDGKVIDVKLLLNNIEVNTDNVLVYDGTKNDGEVKVTDILLKKDEILLLKVNGSIPINQKFSTNLIWEVKE